MCGMTSRHIPEPTPARRWVTPLLAIYISLALPGCGGDGPHITTAFAKVVIDKTVLKFVRGFEVAVLHVTSKQGASVACADFPSKYQFGHPDLRLVARQFISWSGQEDEARMVLEVTPEQPFIVAVEGRAPYNAVEHVVVRGCNPPVIARKDANNAVEVDATATAGRPCADQAQCEPTLSHCLTGPGFPTSGYCGVAGCAGDEQCPPATKCVNMGSGTVCARVCENTANDCETLGGQECIRRVGPGGCHGVCLKNDSPGTSC